MSCQMLVFMFKIINEKIKRNLEINFVKENHNHSLIFFYLVTHSRNAKTNKLYAQAQRF